MLLVAPAIAYTGSVDYPELFKYSDQKNANLETALQSISSSFRNNSVPITQELLAAIMATLDKEVEVANYLPVEEKGDYGMGANCTFKIKGSCKSTPYDGGADYKGRGYIQITGKSNYQTYCGSDCVGTSSPEADVCGCKNQKYCTFTDAVTCPQVKALQPDYAAKIFASFYVKSPTGKDLVLLSKAKNYNAVGKAINGGEAYASDFNYIASGYLTLFENNPDKTNLLLTWLNSGTSGAEHRPLLLEQIALGEGTDNATAKGHQFDSGYDVPFDYGKYGRPSTPLTKMTVREVMDFQAQMIAAQIKAGIDPKDASGAVGKYQINQTNLLDLMNRFNPGISLDTKFNVLTQDMLAISILDKRGYNEWLDGKKSDHDFQKNLAKEWASVADPDTGKSYYGGQNIGTTDAQIKEAMAQSKSIWTSYICGCYAKLGRVCPY